MELADKVHTVLTEAFPPPAKVELEVTGRIIGAVVSSRFEGLESHDGMRIPWDILGKKLSQEKLRRVLMIVAATPDEELAYTV